MIKENTGRASSSNGQAHDDSSLSTLIVDSIQDIKGKKIIKLDLSTLDDAPAETFIICEGESSTQMRAISGNIYRRVKDELGLIPNHTEGAADSKWLLIDYFTTVVHIFYPDSRSFYDLEGLWNDAKTVEIPDFEPWDTTS